MAFEFTYRGNLPWLKQRTIYLTKHGSQAYGTNTPTSDLDIKGIAIPPKEYFLGFVNRFEQAEVDGSDFVIFGIQKFLHLAADCNPNIIEVLWTDPADHLLTTPMAKTLIEHRETFLSKKAKHTFSGYALSQLKRIRTHHRWLLSPPKTPPTREEFGLPERSTLPKDQLSAAQSLIEKKLDEWNIDFENVSEGERTTALDKFSEILAEMQLHSDGRFRAAGRAVGYDENFLVFLEKERSYRSKQREWKQFQHWKATRNPARAALEEKFGYDCYLDDTEFLTETGWKRYDEIPNGLRLATVQQKTGQIEFQQPFERVSKPYSGKMIHFQSENTDCMVTPNHRMWVSPVLEVSADFSKNFVGNAEGKTWKILSAQALVDDKRRWFRFRNTATPEKNEYPVDDAYLCLLALLCSENIWRQCRNLYLHEQVFVFSPKDEIQKNLLEYLCEKYPEKIQKSTASKLKKHIFNENHACNDRYLLLDKQWGEKLYQEHMSFETMILPSWVFLLAGRQIRLLIENLSKDFENRKKQVSIFQTKNSLLADQMQTLCFFAGISSKIVNHNPTGKQSSYQVWIAKKESVSIDINTENHSLHTKTKVLTGGRIVCFSVSNEILVTRRNGKIAVQGNTKHGMHLVRLLRMCREILETGKVVVKRPDAKELLAIRNGAWSYEKMEEWASKEDKELEEVMKRSALPKRPDRNKIDSLCIQMVEKSFSDKGISS